MSIEQEIRNEIDNIKQLKIDVGDINNHLSVLEGLCRERNQKAVDEAYQRGLDDAWEAAKKIVCDDELDWNTLLHIFNRGNFEGIFGNFSPSEAIAKLKAYEEKQKADDKIVVGDEVKHNRGWVAVVTQIDELGLSCVDRTGAVASYSDISKFTKTGRHFDIDKILEEMRT